MEARLHAGVAPAATPAAVQRGAAACLRAGQRVAGAGQLLRPGQQARGVLHAGAQGAGAAGGLQFALDHGAGAGGAERQVGPAAGCVGADLGAAGQLRIVGAHAQRAQAEQAIGPVALRHRIPQAQRAQIARQRLAGRFAAPRGGAGARGPRLQCHVETDAGAFARHLGRAVERKGCQLRVHARRVDAGDAGVDLPGAGRAGWRRGRTVARNGGRARRRRRGGRLRGGRADPAAGGFDAAAADLRLERAHRGHAALPGDIGQQLLDRQLALVPRPGGAVGQVGIDGPAGRTAFGQRRHVEPARQVGARRLGPDGADVECPHAGMRLGQRLCRPGGDAGGDMGFRDVTGGGRGGGHGGGAGGWRGRGRCCWRRCCGSGWGRPRRKACQRRQRRNGGR